MRKIALTMSGVLALSVGAFVAWRRNPRLGTGTMNRLVNPFLVGRRLAGGRRAEVGVLEHVGRVSGTRRLTPVHPVATEGGFRIIVPLGLESQWARNVLAAGHCRLQLHDTVYELDEPNLLLPRQLEGATALSRWFGTVAGFRYLQLRVFDQHPGELVISEPAIGAPSEVVVEAQPPVEAEPALV